ncbi:hypothetical protein [Flavobacterium chungangensis]|uniref:Uncharacterized protein n=1 Tax=Flavobacterium chungangensis TaxID=2708132 RepID=A0ABV8Z960_9FLAO
MYKLYWSGVSCGILNGSLFAAADGSYYGISAGFGKSKEVFGGKRDNKSFELSGAKLIERLSILPGPKKD